MTQTEFIAWIDQTHDAAFAGFAKWFRTGSREAVSARLTMWYARLGKYDAATLLAATGALFDANSRPWGEHVQWLARYCQEGGGLVALRSPTCERCGGGGTVSIDWLRPAFTDRGIRVSTGVAICNLPNCSEGIRFANRHAERKDKRIGLPVFDPANMRLRDQAEPGPQLLAHQVDTSDPEGF